MKIYLFDPETGLYLGEDFADEDPMQRGVFVVPPGATTIAPPEIGPGEKPVFNALMHCWEVRKRPAAARISIYDRLGGDTTEGLL